MNFPVKWVSELGIRGQRIECLERLQDFSTLHTTPMLQKPTTTHSGIKSKSEFPHWCQIPPMLHAVLTVQLQHPTHSSGMLRH